MSVSELLALNNYQGFLEKLTVANFQVTTNPVSGYVLTSDAKGNATWETPAGEFSQIVLSPYVVDGSGNTPGAYLTIGAALAAITLSPPSTQAFVFVKPFSYFEDLVITTTALNIHFQAVSNTNDGLGVNFYGSVTNEFSSNISFDNFTFHDNGGNNFIIGDSKVLNSPHISLSNGFVFNNSSDCFNILPNAILNINNVDVNSSTGGAFIGAAPGDARGVVFIITNSIVNSLSNCFALDATGGSGQITLTDNNITNSNGANLLLGVGMVCISNYNHYVDTDADNPTWLLSDISTLLTSFHDTNTSNDTTDSAYITGSGSFFAGALVLPGQTGSLGVTKSIFPLAT